MSARTRPTTKATNRVQARMLHRVDEMAETTGLRFSPSVGVPPAAFVPGDILQLQRQVGNHITSSLMRQAKPTMAIVQRLKHTPDQVTAALTSGDEKLVTAGEQKLINDHGLVYDTHNDQWIFLKAGVTQEAGVNTWEHDPPYWYRAMTADEFTKVEGSGKVPTGDSYGGVGPNRSYSAGYMGNNSTAPYLVEYHAPGVAKELLQYVQPKAEGGGTWGLGDTGTSMNNVSGARQKELKEKYPDEAKARLDAVNSAWQEKHRGKTRKTALSVAEKMAALPQPIDIFNKMLRGWRLVNLRIKNRLPT